MKNWNAPHFKKRSKWKWRDKRKNAKAKKLAKVALVVGRHEQD